MHECILCERDMKKSKDVFGGTCINNTFKFLDIQKPMKVKNQEEILYQNIMKRTNASRLNKNQRIWLTDRYLTYQYLDKLQYGNFEELKMKLNTDIENIKKTQKFEEMITAKRIRLKEVYDLYRKERKFETNLNKLKENSIQDDEKLKLLIASFSFIFNLYRNKNQYEKDMFKAMQYTFWQTVIEVGGKYANFEIAAQLLQHSLEEEPTDLFITKGEVVEEIKKDTQFRENINNIIKKYGSNNNEFIFDSGINADFPMNFDNNDLYFSIHSAELKLTGKKQDEKWNLIIQLHDRYDYSNPKKIIEYYNDTSNIPKSIFSSTLYNLAHYSIRLKVMKEYDIDVQIELDNFEVI